MNYDKWSLQEKKKLSQLLDMYPLNAYKAMSKRIVTKTEEEVQTFIERMKYSAMTYNEPVPEQKKDLYRAPLDEWIDICYGLVDNEPFDTSSQLSKVMSIIAYLEDVPETDKHPPVDYQSIYLYLAQILQEDRHEDLEHLRPLESAVLLDVIHSLMDVLCVGDTTVQRNIMKWKCKLMDSRDGQRHPIPENIRKAADNDFVEFIQEEEEKQKQLLKVMEDQTKTLKEKEKEKSICKHSTYEAQPSSSETDKTGTKRSDNPKMVSFTTAAGKVCTYQQSWRHTPGRKRILDPVKEVPVTDIVVVMPPKNAKIINYAPRAKKARKDRDDGKYQSLDAEEKFGGIVNEQFRAASKDPESNLTEPVQVKLSCQGERRQEKIKQVQERVKAVIKIYEEQNRKYQQLKESAAKPAKKKPKLYTINPFNIPISILDLDS